ncbi:MAG: hypothetical protein FJX78_04850 [Armatimonadetes bacterium]|nr:hypothetical protein [Armatimonadota bacterium]
MGISSWWAERRKRYERCGHGVGNLYVASSSVFPTSGAGIPTTIVALAIRLADRLRRRLSG